MLHTLFNTLTYRTAASAPDPATGLDIVPGRWGGRTVHDPRIPAYLETRRRRIVRDGMDDVDRALMDPATAALLAATAARMPAEDAQRTRVRLPLAA
jgi:hypothetical protein